MHKILNNSTFFFRERTALLKMSYAYDVIDPESGTAMIYCLEEKLDKNTKIARLGKLKSKTPFCFRIETNDGDKIMYIKKKISAFITTVDIFDEYDELAGRFQFSSDSTNDFEVTDMNRKLMFELQKMDDNSGYRYIKKAIEFATIHKHWSGIGREFFTSADNYVLSIDERVPKDHNVRILIFAAVICMDMIVNN